MKKDQLSSLWIVWCIVGLIVLGLMVLVFWNHKGQNTNKTNRELVLTCTTDMATQFHIHSHLEIVINGQQQEIPSDIGIKSDCMNAIHTHDNSGKIHVESPEKRDFNLSDFFAVWGKTYNKDQILDYKVDATHSIRETINGKEIHDYESTVLRDNDQIIIYYELKK